MLVSSDKAVQLLTLQSQQFQACRCLCLEGFQQAEDSGQYELRVFTPNSKSVGVCFQLLCILGHPLECSIAVLQACWKLMLWSKSVLHRDNDHVCLLGQVST